MSKKPLIVPTYPVHGRVHTPAHGPTWLELLPPPAEGETVPTQYLRFAIPEMGPERPIFPAVVLDDWGQERAGMSLYRWVREEGDMFPRAEIFGYTADGVPEQAFLRDLELHFAYPVRVYPTIDTPLAEGVWLTQVVVVNTAVATPQPSTTPDPTHWPTTHPLPTFPFNHAKLTWWQIPPALLLPLQEAWTLSLS
jgi:hypothetical protein